MHNGASDAESADGSRLAGSKVLVAEAMAVIALDLERTLRGFDCDVLGPVGSVAAALRLLERERPDAALFELDLSDGHAAPLAEMLASLGVPFALATAHDCSEQDELVLRGVPCVTKPYGSRQLYRTLVNLLGSDPEMLKSMPLIRSPCKLEAWSPRVRGFRFRQPATTANVARRSSARLRPATWRAPEGRRATG